MQFQPVYACIINSTYLCMQYTVCEAAKFSGLWEKAPYMEDISSDALKEFYDHVSYQQ